MDILSYLLELLQQRKEVGITGLGTFYKKKFPGRYDKEKQSFLPPGYALQFTSEVKIDDALASYISSKRNISSESADYYIAQFVNEITQKLEVEHEADLENLGRLFFTEHEGLSFEAAKNINYGSEFYGLPALPETVIEEPKDITAEEEEVYDEIAEAPVTPVQPEAQEQQHPVIETIELDEVQDDLKNTLKHTEKPAEEIIEAPEFIKEQHAEHPDRFGHTPEDEAAVKALTDHEVEVPESVVEQHEEHPNRFGHTPESEEPKTYIHLEDNVKVDEPIIEAPEFIKEQHAEHPNRFGHDPIAENVPGEDHKSVWPKVLTIIFILLVIGGILYFVKPELFNREAEPNPLPPTLVDSPKTEIDTAKAKQDSIAKTDSILKANQVSTQVDSVKKPLVVKPNIDQENTRSTIKKSGTVTFDVIAASYETVQGAERYIKAVKNVGITAKIVKMPGKRQNISIGSFNTQQEAEEQKDILQKKLKGKGFYVQQINNTP
ncbi:SPOR domain-containing protein [Pedobacter chinensis]|uniref:SPOR domain-containing protein n=1 Tax=Pedobacter chinensis TaxID=2282421 RepID=A0A369PS03_9SPHI|nr:AraC family transcriptional regulator [Pedobacter chinensis]RDC55421.1 SPOR domain-containing protein [Pedobacter chinensis]